MWTGAQHGASQSQAQPVSLQGPEGTRTIQDHLTRPTQPAGYPDGSALRPQDHCLLYFKQQKQNHTCTPQVSQALTVIFIHGTFGEVFNPLIGNDGETMVPLQGFSY